jgi:hypothetical protein
MATIDGLFSSMAVFGSWTVIVIAVGIIVLALLGLVTWTVIVKKRWNLLVEFKMVRSDGRITIPEWGKGRYDPKEGLIYLKRKRKRAEAVKAKRLDKYLQGVNTLTAVGNPGNWRLVIPETFLEVVDDETGETASIVRLRADTKDDKSWSVNFERSAKNAFTISNFMTQYGRALEIGFIVMITVISNFIGFSIVLGRMK